MLDCKAALTQVAGQLLNPLPHWLDSLSLRVFYRCTEAQLGGDVAFPVLDASCVSANLERVG